MESSLLGEQIFPYRADPTDKAASLNVYQFTLNVNSHFAILVLQIRRGKRDNLGIILHITPLNCML